MDDDIAEVIEAAVARWLTLRSTAALSAAPREEMLIGGRRCWISALPGGSAETVRLAVDVQVAPERVLRAELEIATPASTVN